MLTIANEHIFKLQVSHKNIYMISNDWAILVLEEFTKFAFGKQKVLWFSGSFSSSGFSVSGGKSPY
jgi:uncharacterized membrane protein YgcG